MSICTKCTGTGRIAARNEATGGYDILACPDCDNRGILIGEGSEAHTKAMEKVYRQVGLEYIVVPDLIATQILEAAFPKKGLPGRTSVLPAKEE